jgi:hypothetical protein
MCVCVCFLLFSDIIFQEVHQYFRIRKCPEVKWLKLAKRRGTNWYKADQAVHIPCIATTLQDEIVVRYKSSEMRQYEMVCKRQHWVKITLKRKLILGKECNHSVQNCMSFRQLLAKQTLQYINVKSCALFYSSEKLDVSDSRHLRTRAEGEAWTWSEWQNVEGDEKCVQKNFNGET